MILVDDEPDFEDEDVLSAKLFVLAEAMRQAAEDAHPRELFYAAAVVMSYALARQSDAIRDDAINTALEIIRNGQRVLGRSRPALDA